MTTALALILAAPLLALAVLWAWSHTVIDRKPQTVPEAAVRVLLHLARWLAALAEALTVGGLAYRDWMATRSIESRLEAHTKACQSLRPQVEIEPQQRQLTARSPYWWWARRHEDAQ